jgi:S-methylmethionine-dependent homocysteine/selenocysteine methylase
MSGTSAMNRKQLPQLQGGLFLTDGGLETTAIFHDGMDLPFNAAFLLLRTVEGRQWLKDYFERYVQIAIAVGSGFILETPTWRASPDWAARIGIDLAELDALNADAVALMREIALPHAAASTTLVVSGCVGPRRDGYAPDLAMTEPEAEAYHGRQIGVFAAAGADLVTAITMTNFAEAVGISRAAQSAGMPVVISFTVETDGRLPTGDTLRQAIEAVDAATEAAPAYYMINCAHPTHFSAALAADEPWVARVRGLRTNSSRLSHAELDNSTRLDVGNPAELGLQHRSMRDVHRHINVLGGCCGTDHRHVEHIARAH